MSAANCDASAGNNRRCRISPSAQRDLRGAMGYALCMRYRRLRIPGASYFFTVVAAGRRPVFRDPNAVAALRHAFIEVKARHPFEMPAIVVLPDHLHCIWNLPEGDSDYANRWLLIKANATRRLRAAGFNGAVWQRRFWEHCLRDERDFAQHADYIHYNPVRHGLAKRASEWRWSSIHRWIECGWYDAGWGASVPELPDDIGRE
jgi:putative transposase